MSGSPTERRVVITGIGMISPFGNSAESLWNAIQAGQSGVTSLAGIETTGIPTTNAAPAKDFTGSIDEFGELEKSQKKAIRKGLKVMCRESKMGVAAAQLALVDAGVKIGEHDPERTGCLYGSDYMVTMPHDFASGVQQCTDADGNFEFNRWAGEGMPRVTPLWLLMYLPNMPASHLAIYNDLRGPNNSITEREASGNLAVGEAYFTISRGSAETIIAGATGTRIHPMKFAHALLQEEIANGQHEPQASSRPFDKNRSGSVLGEGAASLILEEYEHAKSRGATVIAEIIGRGSSTVADADSKPDRQRAMANAMRAALDSAGMQPSDVGHIHAHGLSTRDSDIEESAAIREVFGEDENSPPVVAAKSYFGNLGAASGLIELIASLYAMKAGHLFPLLNYDDPDPAAPIHAADKTTTAGDSVLNLNVTPQGQASCVIVKNVQE